MKESNYVFVLVCLCLILHWHEGFGAELSRFPPVDGANETKPEESLTTNIFEKDVTRRRDYTNIEPEGPWRKIKACLKSGYNALYKLFKYATAFVRSILRRLFLRLFSKNNRFYQFISQIKDDDPISESAVLDTNRAFFPAGLSNLETFKLILPGTKWCGDGDKAKNDTDFGIFTGTDICCRNHDKCPDNILTNETKYDLHNSDSFTRSLCSCDEEFFNCLKNDNTTISKVVGLTYFDMVRPLCFQSVNCSDPSITCRDPKEQETEYHWQYIPHVFCIEEQNK